MPVSSPATDFRRLHASPPTALSFAPSLHVRSFLLERDAGNLLIYGAPATPPGAIARAYLNHWHEAGLGPAVEVPLFVHEADRAETARHRHVRGTFTRRHKLDDDFEVIPTPGHTPGATSFLWDNGEHRFLFTGDTLYLADGELVAAVLDSSDRTAYVESLELIRGLDFDVLVPWAAGAGQPYHVAGGADRVDAVLDRVRAGGDR